MRAAVLVATLFAVAPLAGCLAGDDPDPNPLPELPVDPLPATGLQRILPIGSFEPTIGVTDDGTVFMSVFAFLPHETVYRSQDGGESWENVSPSYAGVTGYPGNSNDPFIFYDQDTGRLFNFEMQGLSCNTMAFSDDLGESWTLSPLGCTPTQGLQDHQSLFTSHPRTVTTVGYEKVVHYCINRVADTACAFSLDGGLTWGPMRGLIYSGVDPTCNVDPPLQSGLPLVAGGLAGHGRGGPDGTIYLPRAYCGVPSIAISEDDGLTWEQVTIAPDHRVVSHSHEVSVGIDESGNVYTTWIGDDKRAWMAASYDRGFTWEEPVDATPPGITHTDFPTIAAGADGRVALAFIGANVTESDDDGAPVPYDEVPWDTNWTAWIVTATGLTGDNETVWRHTMVNPEDDPIARGVCAATRCTGDDGNGLGDFIDIEIDGHGRPWAAFVDVCHELCREATEPPVPNCDGLLAPVFGCAGDDLHQDGYGMVGTLNTGPALIGPLVDLEPLAAANEASTLTE